MQLERMRFHFTLDINSIYFDPFFRWMNGLFPTMSDIQTTDSL